MLAGQEFLMVYETLNIPFNFDGYIFVFTVNSTVNSSGNSSCFEKKNEVKINNLIQPRFSGTTVSRGEKQPKVSTEVY